MTDVRQRIAELSVEQRELLEARLAGRMGGVDRIRPRDPAAVVPLSFQQEREWAIAQYRPANNIPGAFRVVGDLDVDLVGRVLTEVVSRHEVLRSTVQLRDDGSRVQAVHPVEPLSTPIVDLSGWSPQEQRAEVLRRWKAEVVRPFEDGERMRLRVLVLRIRAQEHVVLITTDHVVADFVSMAILVREFAALYGMWASGGSGSLPPLPLQYGDFAVWQREFGAERLAAEVAHWRRTLEGVTGPLVLPSDRPFPVRPTFAGAAHFVDVPKDVAADLRALCERENVGLGQVLLAALSVLLFRYLGQDDLVIGELVSGRGRPEVQDLIGCFVTALPLRMRVADGMTLRQVIQQARQTVLTAYDHQDLPMDRLIGELEFGREASQTSMSHMWLDVRTPEGVLEVPGLRISPEPIEVNVAAAPLTLDADPSRDSLRLQWVYMTEMFDADTVALLADHFDRVLAQVAWVPDTLVRDVHLATGPTSPTEVVPAGAGDRAGTGDQAGAATGGSGFVSFVELFERRVGLAPGAPAVVCGGVSTSYRALNEMANRLAGRLRRLGVGRDARVGILVDRSLSLPVAVLGVLKAGGGYLPLDPTYPPERIGFMLADAGAEVLVTQRKLAAELTDAGIDLPARTVLLDDPTTVDSSEAVDGAAAGPPPGAGWLAYLVYTSGSTGRPKGTMVEHGSLVTFARDVADRLGLGAGDRFLQFASAGFDVLAEELFPTWLAGGAVVIPTEHIISGQVDLVDLIARDRLTVIELPTAYWHEWVRDLDRRGRTLPDCLRLVIIGGERVLPDRLAMWRRLNVPLMHVYGLTETTVSSTFFRVDPGDPTDWSNLPIGTPLPSADLRILDHQLRPVPHGAAGELYIGGPSVARGYHDRPGLTAQRFIADTVRPGGRLYRTGDLVRQRRDGNLEFLSRLDTQIKIRGFRVEPTEIETVLTRHPDIAEAVVQLYEPTPGDRRLAAYLVPEPAATPPTTSQLRQYLERQLPPYMVPSALITLDALPLNSNGKVDRSRLPAPDDHRPDIDADYVAPATPLQRKLADIIATTIGISTVGIHDNFFELGGDSIQAIQVVARAQGDGINLNPLDFFEHPTVALLSQVAEARPTAGADQDDATGDVPLAPTQREFCTAANQPHRWHTSIQLVELSDPAHGQVLDAAVEHVLAHHDGLRQRFQLAGERTQVRIVPPQDADPVARYDLSDLDSESQDRRMAELGEELQASLDPAVGPLVRVGLFRLGTRRPDRFVVVAHRLVADRSSMRILLEDLQTAMTQLAAGQQVALPARTTSWRSWARRLADYIETEPVHAQRAYWEQLVGTPAAALPRDVPAEPAADTVATMGTVTAVLGRAETADLERAALGVLNCATDELLLIALSRTLAGWTGAARHLVDVERHGREPLFPGVDVSRTVGPFGYTHPVAICCEPDAALEETVKTVKESLRTVPSAGIGWLLREYREPEPVTGVIFSFRPEADPPAVAGLTVLPEPGGPGHHPLEVRTSIVDGELVIRWRYSESWYRRPTVQRLADEYVDQVRALVDLGGRATPVHTPSDFPLARVDQGQLDQLLGRL